MWETPPPTNSRSTREKSLSQKRLPTSFIAKDAKHMSGSASRQKLQGRTRRNMSGKRLQRETSGLQLEHVFAGIAPPDRKSRAQRAKKMSGRTHPDRNIIATNANISLSGRRLPTETPLQARNKLLSEQCLPTRTSRRKCNNVYRESAARQKLQGKTRKNSLCRGSAHRQKRQGKILNDRCVGKAPPDRNFIATRANNVCRQSASQRNLQRSSRANHTKSLWRENASRQTPNYKDSNIRESASRQTLHCKARQTRCRKSAS